MTSYICEELKKSELKEDATCVIAPCTLTVADGTPPPLYCPYNHILTGCKWEVVK